jgi:hypothetical protein
MTDRKPQSMLAVAGLILLSLGLLFACYAVGAGEMGSIAVALIAVGGAITAFCLFTGRLTFLG